eukprot:20275-Eustigmatos_ZCMA.PRE.1
MPPPHAVRVVAASSGGLPKDLLSRFATHASVVHLCEYDTHSCSSFSPRSLVSSSSYPASSRNWSLTDALAVEHCGAMSKSRVP